MEAITQKLDVKVIVSELADQMHITENEVIQKAIYEYAEKVRKTKID